MRRERQGREKVNEVVGGEERGRKQMEMKFAPLKCGEK